MRRKAALTLILTGFLTLTGCQSNTQELAGSGGHSEAKADLNGTEKDLGESADPAASERDSGENVDSTAPEKDPGESADPAAPDRDSVTLRFRIVDGAQTGSLMLAGESSYDVYSLSLGNPGQAGGAQSASFSAQDIPVYLDGQEADSSVLEDGMMIEIACNGMVEETFPARLSEVYSVSAYSRGTAQNPSGSYYDLCGLYLQVLSDLWEKDPGLNGSVDYISVDLSEAPGGLTEGEKRAVAWIFAGQHGAQCLTLSYEELIQAGYLAEVETAGDGSHKLYQWEDGILFAITSAEQEEGEHYSLPALRFKAEKWRSPLGAYFLMDCFSVWPEMGTWSDYEIGGEAIARIGRQEIYYS